jgi:WD40 repeat protein
VNALAFSPDGRMLASASGDGAIVFWYTESGAAQRFSIGSFSSVIAMAFSPDGTKLATSHINREVRIRETASPEPSTLVGRFLDTPRALAFSLEGRLLASSVMLCSQLSRCGPLTDGQRATLVSPDAGVPALAFSPGGSFLVVAGRDGLLQVRDESVDREWTIRTGHSGRVWSLALSPDGRSLITGGNDGVIRLWDIGKFIPFETEKLGLLGADSSTARIGYTTSSVIRCEELSAVRAVMFAGRRS